jgi:ABC-type dipeptide/oligopeptide/nickel transport system permease component
VRYLLRRILWLVPSLILASLLGFWSLAGQIRGEPDELRLPVVFNPAPEDVRSLALGAMTRVAQGGASAEDAARMLGRLGGAALPHILPRLDGLPPEARARVALSLGPVGRRMRVASEEELVHPEQAVLFWTHFWEDRALEFRPSVAKRLARRLAERSLATRREEILGLDTYALPALLDELRRVETRADVVRAASLTEILSYVTGRDGRVLVEYEPPEAAKVVEAWRAWWSHHRYEYLTLDGPRRVAAMVLETRYAQWAAEAVRAGLRRTPDSVVRRLGRAAPTTLGLGLFALFGGFAGGMLAALVSVWAPRSRRERASAVAMVTLAALPVTLIAAALSPLGGPLVRTGGAALFVTLLGSAVIAWYLRAAARAVRLADHYRTLVAEGVRPWRIAVLSGREVSVVGLSLLAVHLPEMLSAILLVEHAWGLPGIGALTVAAVAERDAVWLTVVAMLSAGAVWVAQALGDLGLRRLEPRLGTSIGLGRRGFDS